MNKINKYVFKPNLQFFDGYVVKEKDENGVLIEKDLINETIEDKEINQKIHVKQSVRGLTIITDIYSEIEIFGVKNKEKSHLESTYKEGTILVYNEGDGYIYPKMKVCTVEDAIRDLNLLEG